jgi:hypothetical protein
MQKAGWILLVHVAPARPKEANGADSTLDRHTSDVEASPDTQDPVAARGEDDLVPAAGVLFGVFGGAVIPLFLEIRPRRKAPAPQLSNQLRDGRLASGQPVNHAIAATGPINTPLLGHIHTPSGAVDLGLRVPAVARYRLIWRSAANTSPATWYIAVSCTAGPVQLRPSSAPRCLNHHGRPRPLPTALAGQCAVTPGRRPVSSAGLDGVEFAVIAR